MVIGGLQKLTLIDYPGKIACTVFTVGCNFRCPFCHNPELVCNFKTTIIAQPGIVSQPKGCGYRSAGQSNLAEKVAAGFSPRQTINELEFFEFLKSRQGLLDGVCVTGGEPLLHSDLPEFLKKIKGLGFLVKLDTNGTKPDKLEKIVQSGLLDYVAMDIKTNVKTQMSNVKTSYEKVCEVKVNLEDIRKSIDIIMKSGLDYEFRTTVVPGLHTESDIANIAKEIRGAKRYYLQQFVAGEKLLDTNYQKVKPYPIEFLYQIRDKIKNFFEICEVRE